MRIAREEYAAVCGMQRKNMRQYADRAKTSMRQYAEHKRRICGNMRIAREEYAAVCGMQRKTMRQYAVPAVTYTRHPAVLAAYSY